MELVDIGANLAHESFAHDLPDVLHRAARAGVHRMVVTGTSVASTEAAVALHALHPERLFATAGLHPHHASDYDAATREQLRALAEQPGVVAIGECGLDYFRDFSPREAQRAAFAAQLELAVELQLPVFLHQRDAHADFMAVLRDYRPRLKDAVAHCFTGSRVEIEDCLAANLAIGITGWICDERRGHHLLPLVPQVPASRLMIETDAPYLLPRTLKPHPKSRRNEPAFLAEVAATVARARGETIEELARTTTAAAELFFGLRSGARA
jgi:TatD DNase family protein